MDERNKTPNITFASARAETLRFGASLLPQDKQALVDGVVEMVSEIISQRPWKFHGKPSEPEGASFRPGKTEGSRYLLSMVQVDIPLILELDEGR
jgi:hypothetical protein